MRYTIEGKGINLNSTTVRVNNRMKICNNNDCDRKDVCMRTKSEYKTHLSQEVSFNPDTDDCFRRRRAQVVKNQVRLRVR